jgi:hypothetical protein
VWWGALRGSSVSGTRAAGAGFVGLRHLSDLQLMRHLKRFSFHVVLIILLLC